MGASPSRCCLCGWTNCSISHRVISCQNYHTQCESGSGGVVPAAEGGWSVFVSAPASHLQGRHQESDHPKKHVNLLPMSNFQPQRFPNEVFVLYSASNQQIVTVQHLNCPTSNCSHPQFSDVFYCLCKKWIFYFERACSVVSQVRPWALRSTRWCRWHLNIGTAVALWAQWWYHILCGHVTWPHYVMWSLCIMPCIFPRLHPDCSVTCLKAPAEISQRPETRWLSTPQEWRSTARPFVLISLGAMQDVVSCNSVAYIMSCHVGRAVIFNTFTKKRMYLHKRWWLTAEMQVVKTQTRYFICPPTQYLLLLQAWVPMGRCARPMMQITELYYSYL